MNVAISRRQIRFSPNARLWFGMNEWLSFFPTRRERKIQIATSSEVYDSRFRSTARETVTSPTFPLPRRVSARPPPVRSHRSAHVAVRVSSHALKMASCVAKSAVFASAARPNKAKAGAKSSRASSKLWTPKSAAVESPKIIVEGDAASKMAGLTAQRREVIMDMEDFAENEVRARPIPRPSARAGEVSRLPPERPRGAPRGVRYERAPLCSVARFPARRASLSARAAARRRHLADASLPARASRPHSRASPLRSS